MWREDRCESPSAGAPAAADPNHRYPRGARTPPNTPGRDSGRPVTCHRPPQVDRRECDRAASRSSDQGLVKAMAPLNVKTQYNRRRCTGMPKSTPLGMVLPLGLVLSPGMVLPFASVCRSVLGARFLNLSSHFLQGMNLLWQRCYFDVWSVR